MRKLPFLLVLLLASLMLLAAAASAHAVSLPSFAMAPFVKPHDDDESEADDDEADGSDEEPVPVEEVDDEAEDCEDDEVCGEEELEPEAADACLLEGASASFSAAPGAGQVRLRVRYRALQPTQVVVDARLHGSKGALRLGTDRARFRRSGVYRYRFDLGSKQMAKAVAAKDLEVDLYAVGTPADCEMHLASRGPRRAK
jgi:hypothetical protein